jgi:hypothetical protein
MAMKRPSHNKFSIESLERREMMAADATLAGGVLFVQGTDSGDYIVVSQVTQKSSQTLTVTIREGGASGDVVLQRSFNGLQVNHLEIEALDGADAVYNNTTKTGVIFGGPGADTLYGSESADDMIYSGTEFGGTDSGERWIRRLDRCRW